MVKMFNILPEHKQGNKEVDNTQISTSLLLFHSQEEQQEFKRLVKKGMMLEHPLNYKEQNLSDFIFNLLRKHYGDTKG